jgi:hypothetical protein
MWGNIFRIYRAIPFLYELRMMLDWTCTPTTLYLGDWIKLEDIFSGLYINDCNLHFLQVTRRSCPRPWVQSIGMCSDSFLKPHRPSASDSSIPPPIRSLTFIRGDPRRRRKGRRATRSRGAASGARASCTSRS